MHRILYITDPNDPLVAKVRAIARGRLELEIGDGANAPDSLSGFDALLIGDGHLDETLSAVGDLGPKVVQLTRGHHRDVDAEKLAAAGVTVAGASPVLAPYVARHAIGLALAATGEGSTNASPVTDIEARSAALAGKTVGIVGFGRVGRATAELAHLLGATVIYADVRTAPHGSTTASGARRSTLDLLLSKSDIVSLHVQWGPTSNPLIAARELRLMAQGRVLVNTADARLVDHKALAESISAGRIAAAMDVEGSQLPESMPVAFTDYTVARSEEADENVAEFVISNIETALSGGQPDGIVEIVDFPPAGDPAFWSSKMSPRLT